jgi:hypothetical protein
MSDPNQSWGQPENPYGQQPYPQQPYAQPVYGQQPYGAPYQQGRDPEKRPGTVTGAAVTTIVLSALTLLFAAFMAVAVLVARDDFIEGFEGELTPSQRDSFNGDDVATLVLVGVIVLAVWCLIAIVLAVLAMRRSSVARIMLVVSAAVTIVVSLVGIAALVPALTVIAGIVVIVLLFTGGANDWYARRGQQYPQPPQQYGEPPTHQPWG